jgi:methylaspartate ammonia-lyase
MENTHIKQMMLDVRREYEHRLGYVIDDESRLQHYVQDRTALANAWRPYTSYREIGEVFGKDHSSVVHYVKEHEPMISCYPSYIAKYKDAVEITNRVSDRMAVLPKTKLGRTRNLHIELKTVRQTIKKLQEFEKKLEAKLVGREENT